MTLATRCSITLFLVFSLASCGSRTEPAATVDDDRIDLIVKGDYVVTMDESGTVYEHGAVAVDEGLILAIGPAAEIEAGYEAIEVLDGGSRIVMPG